MKGQVYDYKEKGNINPSTVPAGGIISDNSKSSQNTLRLSSGQKHRRIDGKRLSTGSQHQNNVPYEDDYQNLITESKGVKGNVDDKKKEETKVVNYNIYNNYN